MLFYLGKVLVESGFVAETISRELNQRLAHELGFKVSFKELQLDFFPPAISLQEFEAKDFQNNVSVIVGEVEATFGLSIDLILRGKVKKITMRQGEIIIDANLEQKKDEQEKSTELNLQEIYQNQYLPIGAEIEKRIGGIALEDFYFQFNEYESTIDSIEIFPREDNVQLIARASGFHLPESAIPVDIRSIDSLDVNMTWSGSSIQIENLDILQNLNAYKVRGAISQVDGKWKYAIDGKFRGDLELIKTFHPEPDSLPSVKGYADFAFKVDSKNEKPYVEVDGLVGNFESPYARVEELTLSGVYENNIIKLKRLTAVQNKGTLELRSPLDINIDKGVWFSKAKLQMNRMHTNDFLYFLREDLNDLKARVTGPFELSLAADESVDIKNESDIAFNEVMLVDDDFKILNIDSVTARALRVGVKNSIVSIDAKLVGKRGSLIEAKGTISDTNIAIAASSNNIDMRDLGPIVEEDVSGNGSIQIKVSGGGEDVYFDIETNLKKQNIFDIELGNLSSTLRLDLGNKKLHIRSAKGVMGDTAYEGRGSFSFEDKELLDLRINIDKGNYRDLRLALNSILTDFPEQDILSAAFSSRVRLDLDNKGDVRVMGEVVAEDLAFYSEELGRLVGRFEIGSEKIVIEDLILTKSRGKLWGSINLNQKTKYIEYDLKMGGIRLSDFKFYRLSKLTLDGNLEGSFFGSGLTSDFDSLNNLKLSAAKIENRPVADSSLSILTKKNIATASASFLGNAIKLKADLDYFKRDLNFNFNIDEKDIRTFLGLISAHNLSSETVKGRIKSKISGSLNLDNVENLSLEILTSDFVIQAGNKKVEMKKGSNLFSIKDGVVGREKIELTGNLGRMTISGRGRISNRLFIRHDGELSAEILSVLTPKLVRSSGRISSSGVLRKTPNGEFDFFGKIQAKDLGFGIEGVPGVISKGNADISIDSDRMTINKLEANYGEGSVNASGSIIFAVPYPLVNIAYDVINTRVGFLKNSYLIADAEGTLSGQAPPYMLRSKVKIEYGEFGETLAEIIAMFKKESSYGKYLPLRVDLTADRLIQQDVRVDIVRHVVVRNNLSELYLTGGTNLTGPLISPTVQGLVRVIPGQSKIIFKGQEFIVEEGSVRIDGDSRQPPDLRFIANTTVKEYRIRMELLGSTSNLNVSFSSEPALSPEDIISLLTVGVTSDISENLTEKERQSTTMYGVGSFLVDQFRINEELKNSLGVRLSVSPEFDQDGENLLSGKAAVSSGTNSQLKSSTKVKIEKKVSEKVDVSLSSTVGGTLDDKQEMNINYNLNNNWSLEGVYEVKSTLEDTNQTDNSFGFDIKFRKTFK